MGTWQAEENEISSVLIKEGKENFVQLEAGEFDWGQVRWLISQIGELCIKPNS